MTLGPVSFETANIVVILILIIFALLTGLMVPGWQHRKAVKDKEDQIVVLREANDKLLAVGETVNDVLKAVRSTAEHNRAASSGEEASSP
jgi:CHASE1-domain containing sensor protein